MRETPATIEASFPWIAQTRRLVSPSELGGLVKELSPATRDLARLTNASLKLLPQTTLTSRCARQVILPTGDIVIRDEFETGSPNYKEFMYGLVGLSGEGQNFDGNGMYVRFQPGGGSQAVSLGDQAGGSGQFGNNVAVPLGNRPFYPGKRPPYRPDVKCHTNKLPEPQRTGRREVRDQHALVPAELAMKTAIRKHLGDFAAIIGLIVIAVLVSSVILSNQRLSLPAWVPVIGKDFYVIEAEMQTAQSVTPGQGQTVNVAGVEVGEIKSVKLENGRAIIGMKIEPRYDRVYKDATILLRPKTGLKDMVAELTPGTAAAGRLPEGGRIPVSQTLPDVNLDEILAALDADTRDYLTLLLNDGGRALKGNGRELANTIRRIEPTAKLSRRVNEALAERAANIKRAIHNFSLLTEELGDQATTRSPTSSSTPTRSSPAFASQDAACARRCASCPPRCRSRRPRWARRRLWPTSSARRCRRCARPPARSARPSASCGRSCARRRRSSATSCARSRAPRCRPSRSCARRCATSRPPRRRSDEHVQAPQLAAQQLAYNPPGETEEGYLFWFSWANHLAPTIFATQDAHGPIRHGLVIFGCQTAALLDSVAEANPQLGTLVDLLNGPNRTGLCPSSSQEEGGTGGG